MVLNRDDYVDDIRDDVCILLQMDNLDIREFYRLECERDDVPNSPPIKSANRTFYRTKSFLYFNTRHKWTLTTSMNFSFTCWSRFFIRGPIRWVWGFRRNCVWCWNRERLLFSWLMIRCMSLIVFIKNRRWISIESTKSQIWREIDWNEWVIYPHE